MKYQFNTLSSLSILSLLQRVCAALAVVMLLAVAGGCRRERHVRIGVSQCSDDDWRSKMNSEIILEGLLNDKTDIEIRSADDSNAKQIADLRDFASRGADVIVVAPNEAGALTPVIDSIVRAGIPVLVFDRHVNGEGYTAFQGADNDSIGKQAADYLQSKVGPGARILEIWGNPESTPARGRHEGFHEQIDKYEDMEIVASGIANWDNDLAYRLADSLLPLHPEVNVIYAHNDRMAMEAGHAARRHGMRPFIIGIDAAPEIGMKAVEEGEIDATFLYPTEGNRLISTALAMARGDSVPRHTILPDAPVVDRTNAAMLRLQNAQLETETAKIASLKAKVDDYWIAHNTQTSLLYAALIILGLTVALLVLFLKAYWTKRRQQELLSAQNAELEAQRDAQAQLNRQLEAATQTKLMFFTNVSHDLRTPLTLIAEPIRQLRGARNLDDRQRMLVNIADKNVHILQRLINQVLDFRKYENGRMSMHLTEVDLCNLIDEWVTSFQTVARQRHMRLVVDCPDPRPDHLALDVEKIERVFFNLLSNAFKYTPDNGTITITLRQEGDRLVLRVADTGRGISAEDLPNIFDRFFQVDKIHPEGSGIGLSLVKSFVELHEGTISVESEPGVGSTFTVSLPIRHVADTPIEVKSNIGIEEVNTELERVDTDAALAADAGEGDDKRPVLLAVDDNRDILMLLGTLLGDHYRVITAASGAEALRMANKYVPDLVVCDVMMPGIDGLETCRRLKGEVSTSHIPVLMLTACSMDEQRVQGYESGADGYLSKPFDNDVLRARCDSLVQNRRRIHDLYSQSAAPVAAPAKSADKKEEGTPKQPLPAAGQLDNDFYRRFVDTFRARMSDADLNVDALAADLGLGRSQFYRKIKALTNFSPVELMRNIRLREARKQLLGTDRTISEIAYGVGFTTPAYFTKCYREAYGETPTDTRTATH